MNVSRRLSGIDLSDWNEVPQNLGAYWQERSIVLVFIRHFG
jgi:hypothetical protein